MTIDVLRGEGRSHTETAYAHKPDFGAKLLPKPNQTSTIEVADQKTLLWVIEKRREGWSDEARREGRHREEDRSSRRKSQKEKRGEKRQQRREGWRKKRRRDRERRRGHLPLAAGSESTPEMRSEQPAGHKH